MFPSEYVSLDFAYPLVTDEVLELAVINNKLKDNLKSY